jgi:transposase
MPKPLLTDELWALVEPLLPGQRPEPKGGRPRMDDRAALTGILFRAQERHTLGDAPPADGMCGSGMTRWRRLRGWHAAGVWERLQEEGLLDSLGQADLLDCSRASLGSASVPAPRGGAKKPARTRRIAANRAPSATLWSTAGASRSR